MITTTALTKSYNKVPVVRDVSLRCEPGTITGFLGANGAGKTIADAAEKRVGTYSLGMRQRLGVAQALVGEPAALILDEPANGLDPEGIAWMRTLLRDFADRGGTVLLSSHLLHEVQATADHLVVISDGVVVA
ncbi:MAG: ATP-binding cassette domain-containing protein, partial [Candidatus Limnocylindria bacterium]